MLHFRRIAIAILLAFLVWWGVWQVHASDLRAPLWVFPEGTQEWLPLSSNTIELHAEAQTTFRDSEFLVRRIEAGSPKLEGFGDSDWQAIRQHLAK